MGPTARVLGMGSRYVLNELDILFNVQRNFGHTIIHLGRGKEGVCGRTGKLRESVIQTFIYCRRVCPIYP